MTITTTATDLTESWKGPQPKWLVAMKFGERAHMEAFRAGQLYTKPLSAFAAMEEDALRKDRFEGASRISQPHAIKRLTIRSADGKEIIITSKDMAGPLLMSYGPEVACNVFCMFSITVPENDFCNPQNFNFGDSFVIVLDTMKFIRRVSRAARRLGFGFDAASVEYFDEDGYSGRTGPFRKPRTFAYQQEFRLVLRPGSAEPYTVDVGDLSDITSPVHPLNEINQLCDFSPQNARLAGLAGR
jgi:hypothetical protein